MPTPAKNAETVSIPVGHTFGPVEIDCESPLTFPKGIPGFHSYREFELTPLPEGAMPNLLLLRSSDPKDLSFLVQAQGADQDLIDPVDLAEACQHLDIPETDCGLLLIVTTDRANSGCAVTLNLRAPVLVDRSRGLAWQFILSNDSYSVRHELD